MWKNTSISIFVLAKSFQIGELNAIFINFFTFWNEVFKEMLLFNDISSICFLYSGKFEMILINDSLSIIKNSESISVLTEYFR